MFKVNHIQPIFTTRSMSTTTTTTSTAKHPSYVPTMGSDESEDEWEESDTPASSELPPRASSLPIRSPLAKASAQEFSSCPLFSFSQLQAMPANLRLHNFIHDANGYTLYRDEPYRNKQYPGLQLTSETLSEDTVHISMALYYQNGNRVPVRVPDVKSKKNKMVRQKSGVFIERSTIENNRVFFKKKSVNKKSGQDEAFELGVNYSSHTMGVPSQFVFLAIPVQNGRFLMEKAQRSPKFYVKSKRQERHLPQSKKRRTKNVEHLRINTDIQAAERTYNILLAQFNSLQHDNREYNKILSTVKNVLPLMPSGAVQLGLAHATRPMFNENIVNV